MANTNDAFELWKKQQEYIRYQQHQDIAAENTRRIRQRTSPWGSESAFYELNPLRVATGDTKQAGFAVGGGGGGGGSGNGYGIPFRGGYQDKIRQQAIDAAGAEYGAKYGTTRKKMTENPIGAYREMDVFRKEVAASKPKELKAGRDYRVSDINKALEDYHKVMEINTLTETQQKEYDWLSKERQKLMGRKFPEAVTEKKVNKGQGFFGNLFNFNPLFKGAAASSFNAGQTGQPNNQQAITKTKNTKDLDAINWANQNPNDPKAKKIKAFWNIK